MKIPTPVTLLLIASLGVNLALSHHLSKANTALTMSAGGRPLNIGEVLPPIVGLDLKGGPQRISFDNNKPTVVYVFTPSCKWCARNIDNVNTLVTAVKDRFKIVGVSLSETALLEYVRDNRFDFDTVTASGDMRRAWGLSATPQLIVIAPGGRLIREWKGAPAGKVQADIESFFGIRLPGLRPPRKAVKDDSTGS